MKGHLVLMVTRNLISADIHLPNPSFESIYSIQCINFRILPFYKIRDISLKIMTFLQKINFKYILNIN